MAAAETTSPAISTVSRARLWPASIVAAARRAASWTCFDRHSTWRVSEQASHAACCCHGSPRPDAVDVRPCAFKVLCYYGCRSVPVPGAVDVRFSTLERLVAPVAPVFAPGHCRCPALSARLVPAPGVLLRFGSPPVKLTASSAVLFPRLASVDVRPMPAWLTAPIALPLRSAASLPPLLPLRIPPLALCLPRIAPDVVGTAELVWHYPPTRHRRRRKTSVSSVMRDRRQLGGGICAPFSFFFFFFFFFELQLRSRLLVAPRLG
jgi:hypothetical protein